MASDEDGYSFKEILDLTRREQTEGFTETRTLLYQKASADELQRVADALDNYRDETREALQTHEERITTLETDKDLREVGDKVKDDHRARMLTKRQKFWATVGSVGLIMATALSGYIEHVLVGR